MSVLETLLIKVRGETRDYEVAMQRVKGETVQAERSMKSLMGTSFSLRSALVGAAGIGVIAKQLFDLGSAAEETGSKFRTVFGDSTAAVDQFIDSFATMAGLSQTQAREVTATTGAIAQGMGLAGDASARFATDVVRLAGDLSSFNNVPIAETSRAIQAAVTGERESLKRLGIVVLETDVQKRALIMTGKTAVDQLSQEDKAMATLALITERAGVAVGDLARTQDSAANQARALWAELRNIADTIASALMPAFNFIVQNVGRFIKGIQIMGAETAVLVARFNFWKEALLGTEASTMAANEQLRQMRIAAEAVKLEVVGLSTGIENLNLSLPDTTEAARVAAAALMSANVPVRDMSTGIYTTLPAVVDYSGTLTLLGVSADVAASAQERLNSALSKARGLLGGLGALGSALGFAIPGLGSITGILGAATTFGGLFGGGKAMGGPVQAGTAYMVGERGPEMFVPQQSGTIVPNGGINVNFSFPRAMSATDAIRDPIIARTFAEQLRFALESGMKLA